MFCPICRVEYGQGFTKCSDCGVELVATLPPEPPKAKPAFVDYKEVLTTFNPADIAFIKSILDEENITYFFQGENYLRMDPWALPARLMVKSDQVEKVVEILKDIKLKFLGINVSDDSEKNPY
jgi:hypothetical protein